MGCGDSTRSYGAGRVLAERQGGRKGCAGGEAEEGMVEESQEENEEVATTVFKAGEKDVSPTTKWFGE